MSDLMKDFKKNYHTPFKAKEDSEIIGEWDVLDRIGSFVCATNSKNKAQVLSAIFNSHDSLVEQLSEEKFLNKGFGIIINSHVKTIASLNSQLTASNKALVVAVDGINKLKEGNVSCGVHNYCVYILDKVEALASIAKIKKGGSK